MSSDTKSDRFPPQIKFIIGNEAAERYSFYGMKAILTLFMTNYLLFPPDYAQSVYHIFVMAAYFTPLLGAYISDRYWGKYRTIMTLSFFYIFGHAVLAMFETEWGLYLGLILIALGAGGIKPCVSAHVGDQFAKSTKHLLAKVFNLFYFSINFGSFFATLATPYTRKLWGTNVAFGIPGILMALATFVFWLGRKHYVNVPPTGPRKNTPGRVLLKAISSSWDAAAKKFGARAVEEARAVVSIGILYSPIIMFWALFDQTGSSWVLLTEDMYLHGGLIEPDSLQAANPLFIMGLIPIFVFGVYPLFQKMGFNVTAVNKMRVGMFVTASSFAVVALLAWLVEQDYVVSALWMIAPYLVLTAGEVLVSITGLEFAYTQAPRSAKSTVMSLWFVTVALGNFFVAVLVPINPFEGSARFLFWAILTAFVGIIFIVLSAGYKVREYIEDEQLADNEGDGEALPEARVVTD